ncbi:fumarylacetoacetate hydrolase family protein [Lentzea sp.]|uniref:fumarylacetoacetate hydrolase family protein n=1 Tax=Lentzea sp. TaxID=56099 RepID=UPI002BDD44EA|nr:fumarylacetoacetate hydrolase family protein [Lentzea sp.]HUQ56221.1 fumarylacetoacetate hydrolase family protein [Lentzea sp.]
MRIANLAGRAVLLHGDRALDVETASDGRYGPDPMTVLDRWSDFLPWTSTANPNTATQFDPSRLGPPVPRPHQVFAVALNYPPHAAEAGYRPPTDPLVFTKFPSCLTGPHATVELSGSRVDWEVELVVVIGQGGHHIPALRAWQHVAGLTVGQDLSDRHVQMLGSPPQFSLAKSFPGFGPTGPALVTPDEVGNPDDLEISTILNGEVVQQASTADMIFPVTELVARLSAICPLLPGDLVFTGTPAGVGNRMVPPRYLTTNDSLVSRIAGIGELHTTFSQSG